MAVRSLNVFDSSGRFRPMDQGAVYFIIAQVDDVRRVVKIGYSECVYQRYATLATGIAFPSSMRFTWIGRVRSAKHFERHLHEVFKDRHSHGEWFRFNADEIDAMFHSVGMEMVHKIGHAPKWHAVTEAQVSEFQNAKKAVGSKR